AQQWIHRQHMTYAEIDSRRHTEKQNEDRKQHRHFLLPRIIVRPPHDDADACDHQHQKTYWGLDRQHYREEVPPSRTPEFAEQITVVAKLVVFVNRPDT